MRKNKAAGLGDRGRTDPVLVVGLLNGHCVYSGYQPLKDSKREVCFVGCIGEHSADFVDRSGSGASDIAQLSKVMQVIPVWLPGDPMKNPVWQQMESISSMLKTPDICLNDLEEYSTGWYNTLIIELTISLQWALESFLPHGPSEPTEAHRAAFSTVQRLRRLLDLLLPSIGSRHIEYPPRTFYGRHTSVETLLDQLKIDSGDVLTGHSAWVF